MSNDWLKILADYIQNEKCLEIMAGSGIITYGLKKMGFDILATDNFAWNDKWQSWVDIENTDCIDAIKKYAVERPVIVISWPEMGDIAYRALKELRAVNPDAKMVFIGEFGGCCANEDFCDTASRIDDEWSIRINKKFLSWCGIHDLTLILK